MAIVGQDQTPTAATASEKAAAASAPPSTGASESRVGPRTREHAAGPETAAAAVGLSPETMARMRAYRNLRYHEDRQGHFERLLRWSNYATVVLGSAGLTAILALSTFWTGAAALATTLVGAGQLVFDFAKRARDEADLKKECARLLAIAERSGFSPQQVEADLATMYGSELETYHAVNALAYNAAQLAFGRPAETLLKVSGWQKWSRHLFTFEPSDFPDVQGAAGS